MAMGKAQRPIAGDDFLRELLLTGEDVSRCVGSLSKLARHLAGPVVFTGSLAAGWHLLNSGRRPVKSHLNDIDTVALRGPSGVGPALGRDFLVNHFHPYHVFEGDGMLHGVRIRGGRASYRNRYVRTAGRKAENAACGALYGSLLDPLNVNALLRVLRNSLKRAPLIKNTANTALFCHGGRLPALWEGASRTRFESPASKRSARFGHCGHRLHPIATSYTTARHRRRAARRRAAPCSGSRRPG